jgi:hypothetical protein
MYGGPGLRKVTVYEFIDVVGDSIGVDSEALRGFSMEAVE